MVLQRQIHITVTAERVRCRVCLSPCSPAAPHRTWLPNKIHLPWAWEVKAAGTRRRQWCEDCWTCLPLILGCCCFNVLPWLCFVMFIKAFPVYILHCLCVGAVGGPLLCQWSWSVAITKLFSKLLDLKYLIWKAWLNRYSHSCSTPVRWCGAAWWRTAPRSRSTGRSAPSPRGACRWGSREWWVEGRYSKAAAFSS